jgi:hypothetical protein
MEVGYGKEGRLISIGEQQKGRVIRGLFFLSRYRRVPPY